MSVSGAETGIRGARELPSKLARQNEWKNRRKRSLERGLQHRQARGATSRLIHRHVEQGNRHMSWRLHGIQHHTINSHIREGGSPGHPTLRTAVKGRIRSPDDREEGKSMTEEDEWTISCPFGSRVAGMMMIWGAMGRKSLTSERVVLQATPLEVGKSLKILSFERCPDMSQFSYSWCCSSSYCCRTRFAVLSKGEEVEVRSPRRKKRSFAARGETSGSLDPASTEQRKATARRPCRSSSRGSGGSWP